MPVEKIKVLQINKLYAPHIGGVEKVVQDIAEGLKDKVDMKVLVCSNKGKAVVEYINGVEVNRAGSFGIYFSMPLSLSLFTKLRKLSSDRDILHFHMPFPLGDAAYFLSGFKGKVVVWWHSDIVRQKVMMKFYKPLMDRFLKRADRIIVATEGHINGSSYLEPYRDKCVIIPFGIDIRAFENKSREQDGTSSMLTGQAKKILFIGRLIYYKGVDVLLRAFSKVHGAHLYIVGEGPLKEQLKAQAIDSGIAESVHFLGHQSDEDIKILLNSCDLFVLPSVANSEAFGIVQIEAMACSKPVINTSLPTGVPYVSLHEQTGLTVPPGDADALAAAMQRLIDNDDERIQMGLKAKERAMQYFTMDKMLDNVYKLYQDML
jgi:rhamnosyl/mannosyltransferase